MKKGSIFFQFMLSSAAAGILAGGLMLLVLSGPLTRALTAMEKRPLRMVSGEVFEIASETFHNLLDYRKEEDAVEVEIARRDVLAQIQRYRAKEGPEDYHFAVLDEGGGVLVDSSGLLGNSDIPSLSGVTGESEFSFRDREGKTLFAHHRYFPAWRWHLLTLVREEDLIGGIRRIGILMFGAGISGLVILLVLIHLLLRYRIRKPLEALLQSARGLTEGNYGAVRESGSGEARELSEAFNRMTEAIRNRERKLEELAEFTESNPNLLMKVARDGRILYANQSVERKLHELGFPPQHHELLLPDDADDVVADVLSGGEKYREVTWTLRGRTIHYMTFVLAGDEAVVFHGVDATEKIAMEEQLLHAQKMESLGRIAGGVAHDFNNLLAGILGYASLLKSGRIEDPGVFKAIDSIEKAAERGSQLTRQLLGFARKGTHEYRPVDVNRIVDETTAIISQTFLKNIVLEVTKGEDVPHALGDGTQLHQCLMNLCINARDAMPEGGTLSITTGRAVLASDLQEKVVRIPAGTYIEILVEDDGHGMDESTLERVFDPFFTTKDRSRGTGLGMSMVYGIVKNHGGYITVASFPGKGTRVRILIPAGEERDRIPAVPESVDEPGPRPHRAGTALLVDDEEFVRDMGKAMLTSLGYDVLTASDGREGVDIFLREKGRISLTILDLRMPVMDGRRAFEVIREIDPSARIVISTGYSGNEDVDNLRAMGVDAILTKPYTYNEITRTVSLLENL